MHNKPCNEWANVLKLLFFDETRHFPDPESGHFRVWPYPVELRSFGTCHSERELIALRDVTWDLSMSTRPEMARPGVPWVLGSGYFIATVPADPGQELRGSTTLWAEGLGAGVRLWTQSITSQKLTLDDVSFGLPLTLNHTSIPLVQRNKIQQNRKIMNS